MKAEIASITKSHIPGFENLTAEELIIYIARVSNPDNQANTGTSEGLLRYLIKKKHWSPFDMCHFAVNVQTSRAIAAQILRHWSFDFQEFSQRYAEATSVEPIEIREAGSTTRQGSVEGEFNPMVTLTKNGSEGFTLSAREAVDKCVEMAEITYKALLAAGVAKESARMIMPLATSTTLYMNASVRSWLFYFEQRLDSHAQKEHRELAKLIYPLFREQFPVICDVFFMKDGN